MKRIFTALTAAALAAICLAGCSADKPAPDAQEDTKPSQSASGAQIVLTKEQAQEAAQKALNEQAARGEIFSAEDFELQDTQLLAANEEFMAFNAGYGDSAETENTSGNPYYAVTFFYTDSVADVAYYCVDAVTGDILYSGYMGD